MGVLFVILEFAIGFVPLRAIGFMGSEDQQFQADLDEAKARAHDFAKTMERIERGQRELEALGHDRRRERETDDLETEKYV